MFMPFSWLTTSRPIVALAPMAGVTDAPFRRMVKKLAPEVIVYSEFVSTNALAMRSKKTLRMLAYEPGIERPIVVQVFGADPKKFIEACKIIADLGADAIDINMGSPAAKIVSSCYGSALMQKPELAAELVSAAVKAVKIPISVKTRLGWDSSDQLIPFCKNLVAAGAQALAVHGRTYKQKFSGSADFEPIYKLKKEVDVPIIGNGDIKSAEDAVSRLGNLDGVMVGRAAVGNPWLVKEIYEGLNRSEKIDNEQLTIDNYENSKEKKNFDKKIPFILEHLEIAVEMKGERTGIREMRKHLAGYISGFPGAKEMRVRLMEMEKVVDVRNILKKLIIEN